jgi:hypothetical protein
MLKWQNIDHQNLQVMVLSGKYRGKGTQWLSCLITLKCPYRLEAYKAYTEGHIFKCLNNEKVY